MKPGQIVHLLPHTQGAPYADVSFADRDEYGRRERWVIARIDGEMAYVVFPQLVSEMRDISQGAGSVYVHQWPVAHIVPAKSSTILGCRVELKERPPPTGRRYAHRCHAGLRGLVVHADRSEVIVLLDGRAAKIRQSRSGITSAWLVVWPRRRVEVTSG